MSAQPVSESRCHVCAGALREVEAYRDFHRVTSDCKPWPRGGRLGVCSACGLAQAVIDDAWRGESRRIYAQYTIYHQSQGVEQSVFDQNSGVAQTRSDQLFRRVAEAINLPAQGRWLDIGCGNGALLRAVSRQRPDWRLAGVEVNDRNRRAVESIPNLEALYVGGLDQVPGAFDVVSLVHTLEHIESPAGFLRGVRNKLAPGGRLLLEVPDCSQNSFMFLVADHASHFFVPSLKAAVMAAGYEVVTAANDWVAKEITLVARPAEAPLAAPTDATTSLEDIASRIAWLHRLVAQARALADHGKLGIFGTSIAGTWLFAELGGAVQFFVDEDPSRQGRAHLGKPILPPAQVPGDADVFLALPPFLAQQVAARLSGAPGRWHVPPA